MKFFFRPRLLPRNWVALASSKVNGPSNRGTHSPKQCNASYNKRATILNQAKSENKICPVCLEDMRSVVDCGAECVVVTQCGHTFHASCLRKWTEKCQHDQRNAVPCPSCRTTVRSMRVQL